MLIAMEDDAKQDVQPTEHDTWQPLGAASAQLLRRLHESIRFSPVAAGEKSDPRENNEVRRDDRAERKDDDRYVSHRLKEIAAFEEQASGHVPRRRKTKTAHTTATSGEVKLTEPRRQITDVTLHSKQR
jgi:hypothetical protein